MTGLISLKTTARIASLFAACLVLFSTADAQDTARTLSVIPVKGPLKGKSVYAGSHALLVEINRYPGLPGKDLQFALNDVRAMAEILVKSYGFPPANVRILTDGDATLAGIKSALVNLSDSRKVGPEDRVLVYFSGHGQTVKLGAGGEMGFLIPHDARVDLDDSQNAAPYLGTCLPMSQLWDYLGPSAAKHVLVIAGAGTNQASCDQCSCPGDHKATRDSGPQRTKRALHSQAGGAGTNAAAGLGH